MLKRNRVEPRVPMYPRSAGIGVAILGTLVIVGLLATFLISAF